MKQSTPALPDVRSHQWIDLVDLEMCLAIAIKIRRNPRLMRIPYANLRRWRKANRWLAAFHREWLKILATNPWQRVLEILTQDNDEGQRLREGDPFVRVLAVLIPAEDGWDTRVARPTTGGPEPVGPARGVGRLGLEGAAPR